MDFLALGAEGRLMINVGTFCMCAVLSGIYLLLSRCSIEVKEKIRHLSANIAEKFEDFTAMVSRICS